jgi:hypothetical protein
VKAFEIDLHAGPGDIEFPAAFDGYSQVVDSLVSVSHLGAGAGDIVSGERVVLVFGESGIEVLEQLFIGFACVFEIALSGAGADEFLVGLDVGAIFQPVVGGPQEDDLSVTFGDRIVESAEQDVNMRQPEE